MVRYWLLKSDPASYSIEDLQKERRTCWDGVRNYQARNFLRDDLKPGDEALFYHSKASPPCVTGIAKVVRAGYPDPTALDPNNSHYDPAATSENPRWYMVDIEFVEKFPRPVSLDEIKANSALSRMPLINRSRLSVQPVEEREFWEIVRMSRR